MLRKQDVLWLRGHEHRRSTIFTRLAGYGRCIGYGGTPVETAATRSDYPIGDGDTAGWNGFANLTLTGANQMLECRDLTGRLLFRAKRSPQAKAGH